MSDLLFNEVKGWKKDITWKEISVHNEKEIKGFFGPYRYLSNFHLSDVYYEGLKYKAVEIAYHAAKIKPEYRSKFSTLTPYESKKYWKDYPNAFSSGAEWDKVKLSIMSQIVFNKFATSLALKELLLETKDAYLEETNWWKDVYYGRDFYTGKGQNYMGKILMSTRTFLKEFN